MVSHRDTADSPGLPSQFSLGKGLPFCGFHCSQELMDCKGIHQVPVRFPFYVSVAVVSDDGNWVQSTITVKGCVGVSQK